MKKVKIVADSTCDLSKELIEKYDIAIVPLCIIMDDKSYFDGLEVTPPEIFEWANKNYRLERQFRSSNRPHTRTRFS